ncbi:MAG: heavy-metal-associated domain-containing protein [Spirochaetes bacterium]|nr:heavy-metal-associated domain-containing protein [Spirochaetota bacterium]
MQQYKVNDMMCKNCVMHITKAITLKDPNAKVDCNLTTKIVIVDSSLDNSVVMQAIKDAGYTPHPV